MNLVWRYLNVIDGYLGYFEGGWSLFEVFWRELKVISWILSIFNDYLNLIYVKIKNKIMKVSDILVY